MVGLAQGCEGHSDVKTLIMQVYRPVKNEKDDRSTYVQQQVAAGEEDPLQIVHTDLLKLVDTFIKDGYQII